MDFNRFTNFMKNIVVGADTIGRGSGSKTRIGVDSQGRPTAEDIVVGKAGEGLIEKSVIDFVVNTGCMVKLKVEGSPNRRITDLIEKQFEPRQSHIRSLKRILEGMLVKDELHIGYIKHQGRTIALKFFGKEKTEVTRTPPQTMTYQNYTEPGRTIDIPNRDVSRVSGWSDGKRENLKAFRAAEDALNLYTKSLPRMRGTLQASQDNLARQFGMATGDDEGTTEMYKTFVKNTTLNSVSLSPKDYEFKPVPALSMDPYLLYEHVVSQYCLYFRVPPSLLNVKMPSHTDISLAAAYNSFIRKSLAPMLEDVFQTISLDLSEETGSNIQIKVDYNPLVVSGAEEKSKLAGTGIYSTNELREMDGKEPATWEGADEPPNVQGGPKNEKGEEGEEGEDEKNIQRDIRLISST